jgi:hypothetical protein
VVIIFNFEKIIFLFFFLARWLILINFSEYALRNDNAEVTSLLLDSWSASEAAAAESAAVSIPTSSSSASSKGRKSTRSKRNRSASSGGSVESSMGSLFGPDDDEIDWESDLPDFSDPLDFKMETKAGGGKSAPPKKTPAKSATTTSSSSSTTTSSAGLRKFGAKKLETRDDDEDDGGMGGLFGDDDDDFWDESSKAKAGVSPTVAKPTTSKNPMRKSWGDIAVSWHGLILLIIILLLVVGPRIMVTV